MIQLALLFLCSMSFTITLSMDRELSFKPCLKNPKLSKKRPFNPHTLPVALSFAKKDIYLNALVPVPTVIKAKWDCPNQKFLTPLTPNNIQTALEKFVQERAYCSRHLPQYTDSFSPLEQITQQCKEAIQNEIKKLNANQQLNHCIARSRKQKLTELYHVLQTPQERAQNMQYFLLASNQSNPFMLPELAAKIQGCLINN